MSMPDNFISKRYRDPSMSAQQGEPNALLAGLKAAQSELIDSEAETGYGVAAHDQFPSAEHKYIKSRTEDDGFFADWVQRYTEKFAKERSRLEQTKKCLEENLGKINERLEKVSELERATEKIKKNMEALNTEVSSIGKINSEILRQVSQQLHTFQSANE